MLTVAGVAAIAAGFCIGRHRTHSETDDAFVESHIVNLATQMVSGHILRFYAEENDRVTQGQVIAEIDPVPYRDKVKLAQSKVEGAEAELQRQEANLVRVRTEVPIQIEIAKQTLVPGCCCAKSNCPNRGRIGRQRRPGQCYVG